MTETIRKGMMIRISDNINESIKQWGNEKAKKTMKGKIYKVVYSDRTSIDIRTDGNTYAFQKSDVVPLAPSPPIPPVMFDPKDIVGAKDET